ncbi:MAG: efflux RND transporter periplasmic adaptor subunit [Bacteroidales bacterium]
MKRVSATNMHNNIKLSRVKLGNYLRIHSILRYSAVFIIILSLFNVSCTKKSQFEANVPEIEVANPIQRNVVHYLEYPGYTQSLNTVDLVARVSGFLESVNFNSGSIVQKGSLLFVIEPQAYKDKLSAAEADLKTAKALLRFAKESMARVNEAAQTNAVSQMDVIKAETNVDKCEADVTVSRAQLDIAKQNLEYCYIRAPFTGRISKTLVDRGNYVSGAGQNLASIYEDNKIYVNFSIEDAKYIYLLNHQKALKGQTQKNGSLQNGTQKVLVNIDDNSDENSDQYYTGILDYISPNINVNTGTFSLRAVIDNKNLDIRSGLYVKVRLPHNEIENAVMVPETSIGTDQSGRYVYVVNDSNKVLYRNVEVGVLENDNMREIVEGLAPNERYVTKALLKVRDGMIINPKQAQ